MPELFALKSSSLRAAVELVEPIIEVRFRKHLVEDLGSAWYIAQSRDRSECLAIFPNENVEKESLDSTVDGYEIVLYVARSRREAQIKRLIATETRFRFMDLNARLAVVVKEVLERKVGPAPL